MDAADLASLTLDQLQTRLGEALDALHALQMGERAVQWRHADKGAQYAELAKKDELETYIRTLRSAIAARESGTGGLHRPIYLGGFG